MERVWYRQDREAVLAALRRGERPDLATTMACGPLDELVALHDELGILAALDGWRSSAQRAGLPDGLLLRTLATLPFLAEASLSGAAGALFREPAMLLQLGWAPAQIRAGDNGRHRHPDGRQPESLPCHPDTLRDELRRVGAPAWEQAQRAGVRALYARRLVRGRSTPSTAPGWGRACGWWPGLRLGRAAADRRLAAAGGGRLGEGQGGGGHPGADRAGAGAGRAGLHRAAAGRRAVRRRAAAGLAEVRPRHRRAGGAAGRPAAVRGPAGAGARWAGAPGRGTATCGRCQGHKQRRTVEVASAGDLTELGRLRRGGGRGTGRRRRRCGPA